MTSISRIKQQLVAPPHLPKHDQVAKGGPVIVEVEMLIEEKLVEIDQDGTTIWAFTYTERYRAR